jgi:hypothetical protein
MDSAELISAAYWSSFWEWIGDKAFIVVVVALALEYLAGRWAKPHREAIDHARELQVAQLQNDAVRLSKEGDAARAQIAEYQARTAEAELQLTKIRRQVGARKIEEDIFLKELDGHTPPKSVKIWFSEDAVDGGQLGLQLSSLLDKEKWNPSAPSRLPRDDPRLKPSVDSLADIRSQVVLMGPMKSQDKTSAFFGLRNAISSSLGDIVGILQGNVPDDELWIIILPKL